MEFPAGMRRSERSIAGGVYTAPQILMAPPTVSLVATSVADPSKSGAATITVTSSFSLAVTGPSTVTAGNTADFTATLTPCRQLESKPRDFLERRGNGLRGRGSAERFPRAACIPRLRFRRPLQPCKSSPRRKPIHRRRPRFPFPFFL